MLHKKVRPLFPPEVGKDMLVVSLIFEVVRVSIAFYKNNLGYTDVLFTGIIGTILLGFVFLTAKFLQIKLKDFGLKKLNLWDKNEIVFSVIAIPVLVVILYYFNKEKFNTSLNENGFGIMLVSFIFYLCWGFYQEWIYRGFIQTEFTRKYDAATAILFANVLFTFGLCFYQAYQGKYIIVATTFAIGLLFGILYHRSYNLWIVGILHGICSWFLVGMP